MRENLKGAKRIWLVLLAVAAMAVPACGQVSPAAAGSSPEVIYGRVIREIDDPHTGIHWLVVRDAGHPGGPGRLVQAAEFAGWHGDSSSGRSNPVAQTAVDSLHPVVRAGDRMIAEEHTQVADAQLEGVALEPAAAGAAFNLRLRIGGKVVRAVAEGPGKAILQPSLEAGR